MTKDLYCTLGPASYDDQIIPRLAELGTTLFRVNLSHTRLVDLKRTIAFIQDRTSVPVCLDTEGAQIRTGSFVPGEIVLRENSFVRVTTRRVPGDATTFNIYPTDIALALEVGDFISIDFNSVLAQVVETGPEGALLRVLNGGAIGRNKAVTVAREVAMPPLTEKDVAALAVGKEMGIRHVALSFANRPEDVDEIRRHVATDTYIVSKIETLHGLANLEAIAAKSDCLLIDRGDLSRQVALESIPATQKYIITTAKKVGTRVVVATNLLESMVTAPTPTRAEINDIYNTLADGADGLVLAAETAIGQYPIRAAAMITTMIRSFERGNGVGTAFPEQGVSLLVSPHGGRLVNRVDTEIADLDRLPHLPVTVMDLLDCEQIATGTYSPLTGFMDQETLQSVLQDNRLPGGAAWTLPIVLQARAVAVKGFGPGSRIALTGQDGAVHAVMDVGEIYRPELDSLARQWFGTDNLDHPGLARILQGGPVFIGGDITLVRHLPSAFRKYVLTPAESRFLFTHKGWSKVVGFHTRNVIHRAHEHIQMDALRSTAADGLFVSPVVGPKKKGDFLADSVLESYQLMLDFNIFPEGRVVLGTFSTYSRYCGPREAVFTALCRKNMGCSHFIMGRDHTGVGNYYEADALPRLFDQLGDVGIEPVFFGAVAYDIAADAYTDDSARETVAISGTEVRERLGNGQDIPEWFMRDVVQDMLRRKIAANEPVFHD